MAVSFKVPKSPKREIAATDTFMGVDLTNTGVSIEGYRSPYAPNMIRHVPGKVRKRMGYYKDILFGKKVNVNFADGTSARLKEMMLEANEWVKVYDLIQTIKSDASYTLYLEFDYASEEDFYILNDSTLVEAAQPDEEGIYPHFSGTVSCASTDEFTEVDVKTLVEQEIFIKNFSIMLAKDTSYVWSPAPKYFVERETNDPIYGCHFLKKGVDGYDGDRVVNVNRALGTSDEWQEYSTDTFESIYKLGEPPCAAQTIYVDFDYKIDDSAAQLRIYISLIDDSTKITLQDTGGETVHVRKNIRITSTGTQSGTAILYNAGNQNSAVNIKNFSVVYEKDENFAWSPAPEDNNEKFYLKDMYSIIPKDYAITNTFTKETTTIPASSSTTETFAFCDANSHAPGNYQFLSFDISTSKSNADAEIRIFFGVKAGGNTVYSENVRNDQGMYKKHHFEMFSFYPNYLSAVFVTAITSSAGSTKVNINISNLQVKEFNIRDDFTAHSAWYLYHVGKDFYLRASDQGLITKVYSDANEHISRAYQMNGNSYIIDGKEIYEFTIEDGEEVHVVEGDNAYIPLVTIAKEPSGGGTSYEAFNLLQPGFKETFQGKASVTKYQLTFGDLDDTECKVWLLNAQAEWIKKTENTDFTVNRTTGEITFTSAPGVSPIEGEDNVKIQAYRTVEGYRDRITKCITGILFGVSGAPDRLFLTGNTDHPNWDFYSQKDDATYFPDTGYSVLGSEQSQIVGYAIVSNYLAAFKDGFDMSQSVFVREGDLLQSEVEEDVQTSEPVFKLINTLQGEGVVSPYAFGYLQTEPVFLTKAGIYAITEQDITGEKYSQNRSFYLDGQLRKEPNMEKALATVYDNQYILALNNKLYILDGLQATRTDKSEPYATRQYAGFLCTDIPATSLWTDNGVCFGTADGKVCRFYTDEEAITSYNDDGKPIYCCWETPDIDGNLFYKNKTFRYFAVRIMKALKTSVKLYSRRYGIWTLNDETSWNFIREQTSISNMLDFNNLDFSLLSFSADLTERLVHTKLRVKKVDKARFRIENGELDEPFGLNDLALEYIESGNFKG